jgi:hypothetical protein
MAKESNDIMYCSLETAPFTLPNFEMEWMWVGDEADMN